MARNTDKAPWYRYGETLTLAGGQTAAHWLYAPDEELDPAWFNAHRYEESKYLFLDRIVGEMDFELADDEFGPAYLRLWFMMLQADETTGNPELPWDPATAPVRAPDVWNLPFFWTRLFRLEGFAGESLMAVYDDPWWHMVNDRPGRAFGSGTNLYPAFVAASELANEVRFLSWWTLWLKR